MEFLRLTYPSKTGRLKFVTSYGLGLDLHVRRCARNIKVALLIHGS